MRKENQNTNEHIVFLGESGFPLGLAAMQRMTLMAKALLHAGCRVTVISRKGIWEKGQGADFGLEGNYEGIDYRYTSNSVYKPKGFIDRNIQKLKGMYGEFIYLKQLKRSGGIDAAIVSNMKTLHMLRYRIYSSFLDFPIVLNLVEMASSMQHKTSFLAKLNNYLLDNRIVKLFDGALPISDRLMNHYKKISPSRPSLQLPILCDFSKFNVKKNKEEPYFLYCGSMAYKEVMEFVIEAYRSASENNSAKLYMIISGGSYEETDLLKQELNTRFDAQSIRLFSNIPYEQLVHLYTNAIALLIPLRPTIQDTSRFPHKIGEYLASGNPVVTTNVGEIKNYFEDGKTALVADTYSIAAFAEKMKFVLDHGTESKRIGLVGKEMGLNNFDYRTHGERLSKFMGQF